MLHLQGRLMHVIMCSHQASSSQGPQNKYIWYRLDEMGITFTSGLQYYIEILLSLPF